MNSIIGNKFETKFNSVAVKKYIPDTFDMSSDYEIYSINIHTNELVVDLTGSTCKNSSACFEMLTEAKTRELKI